MENLRKILFSSFLLITIFSSCKKSTDDFVPYESSDFNDTEWTSNAAMSNAKEQLIKTALSPTPTTATFNALSSNSVDLNANTQLFLPANAYTLNGSNYSGNVIANLTSVTKKGDYIRNLISSCSPNPLQETVAAFDLNLYSSSKELLGFKQQNKFSLAYGDSNYPMLGYNYYYGNFIQNIINWTFADSLITGGQNLNYNQITIQGISKPVYQINSNSLGWMAINKAINLGATTNCNILLPVNFTNKNTAVFAVFKNNNIVLRLNGNPSNKTFSTNYLPLNSNITFVAISYLDNQFYLGYLETTITNNAQYNIKTTTTPISLSSLNSFLDGL